MKTSVVVLAILSLAILVSVSGRNVVQAREGWFGSDVVAVTNGLSPGEAVITWDRVEEAAYYRIGWVAQADREVDTDGDAKWQEGFVFANVANRGQASHLITGLTPGVEYDFMVASHDGRHARLRPPETYASLQLRQDPAYSPLFDSATAEVALPPAGGATHYRISWTTKADYDAVSDVDHDWRQSATFQEVPNRGQTSHTITGLDPATEYYVVAAPYGGETYGPLPKPQSVDWQLVTAESAWQSVAFQASADCVAHDRFPLSSDFDEEIARYQCPGPNVALSQYCEIFTHDPVLEALCVAAIPDELDETYWIFVPTAYTDPDAVAEQLHGRAFDELREVANRVESYRTFIVEIASQKALGERAHLERFVDFPEGVYAEPEAAVDVIGLIIDGYSLQYEQDSPEYQDLENHIQHLVENPGIYDDEPFGSQGFDAAIMAAVARTVFIGATREQVRILEELPMDPAWPIAVLGARSILDEKSSGDDLVTWGELLEEYHDQLVETLRFTAEIAVEVTAEVVELKYGIPSNVTSFILDNTVMAGFNIYERIHETNEFWDDLTLATVAAQAYWHTYHTTSGDVNPQAKASLLEYMEFSFYQRMYLAATNDVAQEDKIGNLGEPRPSQFTPTLLLRRDFALDRVVDSRWEPAQDFKGFLFEEVTAPQGICADGATMWVAWEDLGEFGIAYPGLVKSFDLATKSSKPIGAFSFPQSVFVLSTPGLGVNQPRGMWCDSMELWVVDPGAKAVYPYPIPPTTANQGPSRSFHRDLDNLSDAGNDNPLGIWAGEGIIWVADNNDDKIYAYNFSTKERHAEKDFDGLNLAGNNDPYGVWSDGSTMWVADREDGNVYAYDMITSNRDVTREFTLVDVPGVISNAHPTGMSSDGAIMWVADSVESKLFAYAPPDGRTAAATVPFGRHWADDFGRLNAAGNHHAEGIWLDNTTMTMWVADHDDDLIYGYDLTSKALVRTIETLKDAGNHDARGIWSNGAIMWVVDHQDDRVYAYRVSDGARVESQEFDLHKEAVLFGNHDATGIWSDGTTIWVADHADDQLYGYDMASKSLVRTIDSLGSAGNYRAEGIWSDGTTMWVADRQDNHIYAYRLSDGARMEDLEFETPGAANNHDMTGIWSDGTTMWVVDQDLAWVYAYHMPPAAAALPLGNPTNLTAAPGSQTGEVTLRWTAAANATVQWVYLVKPDGTDGRYWPHALAGDAATLTVTGLDAGETYFFLVIAGQEQADGTPLWSQWSNWARGTPTSGMVLGETFTAISSGASHTCGLRSNGSVACWGNNVYGQATAPAGETFTAIGSGGFHTCGLRSNGTVACWGNNVYGQATPPADEILTTISSGGSHTCGLRANGTPVCWGKNIDRTGRVVGQSTPPSGETFAAINGGGDHTCALRTNGTVRCWGSNRFGESSPPDGTVLASLSDHSYYHTCGLDAQGTAICWGISFFGVTRPPTGETFSAVGSGDRHTCGLRADGSAICWGSASDGHGRFQGKLIPPEGETFTTISVGWNHTCGITTAGAVACWGDDSQGQSTPPAELSSNTLSSTAPDLVVRSASVSDSNVKAGDTFTFSADVYNRGDATADSTTLRYYRSTNPTVTAGDAEVSTDRVGSLDRAEVGGESERLTAPSVAGTYYYQACVDPVPNESDTTNNCSSVLSLTVQAAGQGDPDLEVYSPSVYDKVFDSGERFNMSFSVRNRGGAASTTTASLKYYRSSDTTINPSDTEIIIQTGITGVGPIAASGQSSVTIRLTAHTSGVYYYGVCVGSVPGESNTTNNCAAVFRVTLAVPDLVVRSASVSDSSVEAGDRFTFSATVYNQGNGAADSTTLRYYRSTDSTVNTNDTEVDTDPVRSLDPAEDGDESERLTAPSSAGTYYYGACVDSVDGESNTRNNCSTSVMVTVTSGEEEAPDMVADPPSFNDYNPERGTSIMLTFSARNQGDATAPATTLRVYYSIYSDFRHEIEVENFAIPSLRASRSFRNTLLNYNAPNWVSTFYYRACVDAVSGESDTQNNCSEASVLTTRERSP